jgi:predicted dinucleotide-binding enzyme
MKIGILGSGNIGGTLGRHWAKVGHEVMFSSKNPEELKPMAAEAGAQTGSVEAAAFGEVILLAVHERYFYDPVNIQGKAKEINLVH